MRSVEPALAKNNTRRSSERSELGPKKNKTSRTNLLVFYYYIYYTRKKDMGGDE